MLGPWFLLLELDPIPCPAVLWRLTCESHSDPLAQHPGPGYVLLPLAWARPPPVLPVALGPLPPCSRCSSCIIPLNHVVQTLLRPNRSLVQPLHPPAARLKIQQCFLGEPPYQPALPAGPELFQLGSLPFRFLLLFLRDGCPSLFFHSPATVGVLGRWRSLEAGCGSHYHGVLCKRVLKPAEPQVLFSWPPAQC